MPSVTAAADFTGAGAIADAGPDIEIRCQYESRSCALVPMITYPPFVWQLQTPLMTTSLVMRAIETAVLVTFIRMRMRMRVVTGSDSGSDGANSKNVFSGRQP